jgi:hypothetical protein
MAPFQNTKLISALRRITAGKYYYRGTNYVTEENIRKTNLHVGSGHFGNGMYLSPDADVAISYVDKNKPDPYLAEYRIEGRILEMRNNDPASGLFNPNNPIIFNKLEHVPQKLQAVILNSQEALGALVLKKGYDAVSLAGEYIDGGEQLLIPEGSKAKIKLISLEEL